MRFERTVINNPPKVSACFLRTVLRYQSNIVHSTLKLKALVWIQVCLFVCQPSLCSFNNWSGKPSQQQK